MSFTVLLGIANPMPGAEPPSSGFIATSVGMPIDATVEIHEPATAVAGVDGGTRLDRRRQYDTVAFVDRSRFGAHDAVGDGAGEPERVPDREDDSPTRTFDESANDAGRSPVASTWTTARSSGSYDPTTVPRSRLPSASLTRMVVAPWTTFARWSRCRRRGCRSHRSRVRSRWKSRRPMDGHDPTHCGTRPATPRRPRARTNHGRRGAAGRVPGCRGSGGHDEHRHERPSQSPSVSHVRASLSHSKSKSTRTCLWISPRTECSSLGTSQPRAEAAQQNERGGGHDDRFGAGLAVFEPQQSHSAAQHTGDEPGRGAPGADNSR